MPVLYGHEKSDPGVVAVKPSEQSGAIRCGVGGAKGRDRGECAPTKHALGSEPDKHDTGRWLVYGIELPSLQRWEPHAGKPPVRICAGGAR